ncbi:MAG: DUF1015 family protein, partial [Gammaproteobacteria bacterium]
MDLAAAICPPFDVISAEQQRDLHARSPHNAIHVELADNSDGRRYQRSAEMFARWLADGILRKDDVAGFYVYGQPFALEGKQYTRRSVFARVRLEPWERGVVVPHEQTFGAPKEDRLKLLRATRVNGSPVFLIHRDSAGHLSDLLDSAPKRAAAPPFVSDDGQMHGLAIIDEPDAAAAITAAFSDQTLY